MPSLTPSANPFALLLDPQAVLASIEHSDRLERLHRRVCRPLDKPVLPNVPAAGDANSFDQSIDDAADDLN